MSRFKGLHLEPLWWGLFSAGGVCFAVFLPAVLLVFAVLAPLGVIHLNMNALATAAGSIWGLLFVGAVICLPAFHAAHRIRHGLHDLKLGGGLWSVVLCYGAAALISASALWGWLALTSWF
ncbi:fumarate reductase subunit FrdD [Aliidiomarina celeris]|uniref:fumarate reductase subunit FrdD n=1 Tax=Aliidiomarina celeris TaxID=2249428 RepID=UPI000DE81D53|nr:fumarate reductase subunit FrdD [Aliidiomarina celeris]